MDKTSRDCQGSARKDRTITVLHNHHSRSSLAEISLSLRVGSFNVNGKFPSQDLSPWLQSSSGPAWIYPLKPLSPLELSYDFPPGGKIILANSLVLL